MSRSLLEIKPSLRLDLGEGAYLRPITVADVTAAYVDGLNDPDVHRYMEGPRKRRQTRESVCAYVTENAADSRAILFGIYSGGLLRGTVRLHDVDLDHSTATIGIALFDRRVWGKGLGSAAVARVVRFAFDELDLARLEAGIIEANAGSARAFEKAGFHRAKAKTPDADLGAVGLWVIEDGGL